MRNIYRTNDTYNNEETSIQYCFRSVFIAAGYSDRPDIAEGMASLYLKYKAAKVPAELHLFANAGHGFGYRHNAKPSAVARWPERFTEWLIDSELLKEVETKSP